MLLLCSSNGLRAALTSTIYFMVALSTCSTKECGLQFPEKMKSRSGVFRNVDVKLCQTECVEDSFIFASCRRSRGESKETETTSRSSIHPETHPSVPTKSCGSEVCNETSQCVDDGCEKVCMEAPPLCDLHTASKTGNLSSLKFVLSQGRWDVNCQEWIGRTPVMWAASGGHREVVELLVSRGANVSLVDRFDINILHAACLGGDVDVVKHVLSQNMLDIDGRVRCGRTAVMLAAENGHKDVVELLVDKEADVSLVDNARNNILHCACMGGHAEVVKYILSQDMVDINSRGRDIKTPVIVAGEEGHKKVVELLVKHGADLSLRQNSGNNILHLACNRGQFNVVKYILSLNLVDIDSRGYKKKTPVIAAAEQGHKEVVELLVKHGANLSLRQNSGNNILHLACNRGQFDVVKYILSRNSVDINSSGYKKRTPVMAAAEQGHKEVVELLVKHGADLSLRKHSGSNILHLACNRGQFDVVKYVVSLNLVDIDSRGYKKRTPVMAAAEQGHKEVVGLLVKHEADLSLRDEDGKNTLDLARKGGHLEVVQYVMSL